MDMKSTLTEDVRPQDHAREDLPPAESFEILENEGDEQSRGLLSDDLEKQVAVEEIPPQSVTEGAEYSVSTRKKLSFLGFYFLLNLVSKRKPEI